MQATHRALQEDVYRSAQKPCVTVSSWYVSIPECPSRGASVPSHSGSNPSARHLDCLAFCRKSCIHRSSHRVRLLLPDVANLLNLRVLAPLSLGHIDKVECCIGRVYARCVPAVRWSVLPDWVWWFDLWRSAPLLCSFCEQDTLMQPRGHFGLSAAFLFCFCCALLLFSCCEP